MIVEQASILPIEDSIHHGFATRQGGVSASWESSLSFRPGQTPQTLGENEQRLKAAIGLEAETPLILLNQVHGTRVHEVDAASELLQGDALFTRAPGCAIGIRTADCAPILVFGADVVAAIHAGWRSAVGGILGRVVKAIGAPAQSLSFLIGPCIGPAHFQVGPEVVQAAAASLRTKPVPTRKASDGTDYLDLRALIHAQIEELGASVIEHVGGCTYTNADLYFSHRRDQGKTGRHLAVIARMGA